MLSPSLYLRMKRVLKNTFQLDTLRPGQRQAVQTLLQNRDLLCVLPTGGGKSLCYQLPALLMDGPALVISPLISLMKDQVAHLTEKQIPAALLCSRQGVVEQQDNLQMMRQGQARLIYVAPERLSNPRFQQALQNYPPAMVVVDEAHCVVQWGKDFRPDYQRIPDFIRELPRVPVVCAFTATADARLQRELCHALGLRRPRVVIQPLERANLHYHAILTSDAESWLLRYVQARAGEKGIIFCRTRADTERMASVLQAHGIPAAAYHAGLPDDKRTRNQDYFARGELKTLTATSAFGMGVDIPDIRYVVHLGLCSSPLDYIQQAGRAGRDGMASACVQLITPAQLQWYRRYFQASHDKQQARDLDRLLHIFLDGGCISQGLISIFNQRSRPCGTCSACLRRADGQGGRLASVPQLSRMTEGELRAWCLTLARQRLADERNKRPQQLMSGYTLTMAAETGRLDPAGLDREAYERLSAAIRS